MKTRNRIFALIISVFMLVPIFAMTSIAASLGDINGDGHVNSTDARILLRVAARLDSLSASQKTVADLNGDSHINSTDARILLRVAARLQTIPSETEIRDIDKLSFMINGEKYNIIRDGNKIISKLEKAGWIDVSDPQRSLQYYEPSDLFEPQGFLVYTLNGNNSSLYTTQILYGFTNRSKNKQKPVNCDLDEITIKFYDDEPASITFYNGLTIKSSFNEIKRVLDKPYREYNDSPQSVHYRYTINGQEYEVSISHYTTPHAYGSFTVRIVR